MALEQWENNASSTLASGISAGAASLTVATGEGALFPALTGSEFFYCTLEEGGTIEIIRVTARAGDVFTITRAQQGTSASAFTTAATVEQRLTRDTLDSFVTQDGETPIVGRDGSFELQNTADTSKVADFDLSGITTATTRTLTVPDFDATISQARSIRETGGPTDLVVGAVGDGEILVRSGSTVVGSPRGIDAIGDLSTTVYYGSGGSGEINALGANFTVTVVFSPDLDGSGFDIRWACGTRNNTGTAGGGLAMGALYGRVYGFQLEAVDGAGAAISYQSLWNNISSSGIVTGIPQKWIMLTAIKNGASFSWWCNNNLLDESTVDSGALTSGGEWTIGASAGGATGAGLNNGWLHGAAYVNRAITEDELRSLYRGMVENNQLPDIASSWTRGHRVDGDPTGTWTPFAGSGNMTETGTSTYEGVIANPHFR